LSPPALDSAQAHIPFTILQGTASSFELLQASEITGPWITNTSAILSNVVTGSLFQFTDPHPGANSYYRVLAQ
jgi:hypothetical protein